MAYSPFELPQRKVDKEGDHAMFAKASWQITGAIFLIASMSEAAGARTISSASLSNAVVPVASAAPDSVHDSVTSARLVQYAAPDWRYRFFNGRWWYWLPSDRWAVWNGSTWVLYAPRSYVGTGAYYAYPQVRTGYYSNYTYPAYGYYPRYYRTYPRTYRMYRRDVRRGW
jgi:hypothetical protein